MIYLKNVLARCTPGLYKWPSRLGAAESRPGTTAQDCLAIH